MANVLESVVGTLPAKVQPYAKTYAAALLTGLTVASGLLHFPVWLTVGLAIAQAPVVFMTPNLDPKAKHQDESVQDPPAAPALEDPAKVILVADKPLPPSTPRGGVWGGG